MRTDGARRRPEPGTIAVIVAVGGFVLLQALMWLGVLNPYWQQVLNLAGITLISALGLNLIYGYTGQFSLGHAAFYGVGAYASALLTRSLGPGAGTLLLGIVAGAALAALVAFLIGLPILRLRSDYLAIATLGFGIIMKVLLDNSDAVIPMMGGSSGMSGIARLTTFPWVFAFGLAAVLVMRNLVFSSVGRALVSVREDELAAEAVGIDTTRYKTLGFVIGCGYAGVAGALYAHLYAYLNPFSFDFLKSIDVLLVVVLGGLGSISGTLVAAIAWTFLLEGLRVALPASVQDWRMVIYPLVMIVFMLFRPGGIFARTEFGFLKPRARRGKE
ncbi:branched-chain amino acid ABC transporter permease [candidate division WOR-3 bacterium]|nr:branched-chain amino acid ABC transporter permease [candidate division WOR-3 bacterium]